MYYFPRGSVERCLPIVHKINDLGLDVSLSYLPVAHKTVATVEEDVHAYFNAIKVIKAKKLRSDLTLKVHQFGWYLDPVLSAKCIERIVARAEKAGIFVWVDMELAPTIDWTLDLFYSLKKKHKNVGVCLQAYHRRTEKDLYHLLAKKSAVRLVKGFYKDGDFDNWNQVTANYRKLMKPLLLHSPKPAIATHDIALLDEAKRIITKHKLKNAELQFFYSICDEYAYATAAEGYKCRIYLGFGHVMPFVVKGYMSFDKLRNWKRFFGIRAL